VDNFIQINKKNGKYNNSNGSMEENGKTKNVVPQNHNGLQLIK
jgi:hypothetical protein